MDESIAKDNDWSDANLILINAVGFSERLLHMLALKCCNLEAGAWIFTIGQKLPNVVPGQSLEERQSKPSEAEAQPFFQCILSIEKQMSWGPALVNI